jgi:hypothetical protein
MSAAAALRNPAVMSVDYIYWTFTAAAQSIAAFVAFLLTGYALVHSLMEAARDRDDTLDELHAALLATYHRRLQWLSWFTGAAVILSLGLVYLNRPERPAPGSLQVFAGLVDLITMVAGVAFVVSIVDPRKYQKAAERVLEAEGEASPQVVAPVAQFLDAFLQLERTLRQRMKAQMPGTLSRGSARPSAKQMTDTLFDNDWLDMALRDELRALVKYRNLLVHGHVLNADESMVQRVKLAQRRLSQGLPQVQRKDKPDEPSSVPSE